jgi:hypothetical protein
LEVHAQGVDPRDSAPRRQPDLFFNPATVYLRPGVMLLARGLREIAMKYHCQICEREIDDFASIAHIKAEEYLMELIRKAHPEWKETKSTCRKCVEYYRKLVKDAEI